MAVSNDDVVQAQHTIRVCETILTGIVSHEVHGGQLRVVKQSQTKQHRCLSWTFCLWNTTTDCSVFIFQRPNTPTLPSEHNPQHQTLEFSDEVDKHSVFHHTTLKEAVDELLFLEQPLAGVLLL